MTKLKFVAPLIMAGAAATAIAAAPIAAAESIAALTSTSIMQFAPESPGGDGCYNGICGSRHRRGFRVQTA